MSGVEKLENIVTGMKIGLRERIQCTTCLLGKQIKTKSTVARTRSSKPFELVHTNLAGPIYSQRLGKVLNIALYSLMITLVSCMYIF